MSRARSLVLAHLPAEPACSPPRRPSPARRRPAGWTDGYVIGQRHPPALLAHRRGQAGRW